LDVRFGFFHDCLLKARLRQRLEETREPNASGGEAKVLASALPLPTILPLHEFLRIVCKLMPSFLNNLPLGERLGKKTSSIPRRFAV
jgi:hypothetical protein